MTPTARYPEPNVIRFVRRYFPAPGHVLDIGSGSGNHSRFFEDEGWKVTAVDISRSSRAHYHRDITVISFGAESFDLVLDHNALCHVPDPPFQKIWDWLKPAGAFLCVHPTNETWDGVGEGREYTRFASEYEMRDMLKMFREVRIKFAEYPDFRDHVIKSWIAWGWK